jgi:outer membrane protein assembly factor BamB
VHDGAVFVHYGALGTARLRAADGQLEWLCTELVYPPMHGSGGSPALGDGKLAIVCDGSAEPFVAALDVRDGHIAWKRPRGVAARVSHSFVTPRLVEVDGRTQVVAPGPDHCAAYDLATGEELWRVVAPGWSVVPQPTVYDGLVIYNRDYDHPELMAVRLGGAGDVTETHVAWRRQRGAPSTPTPLLVGDELFTVSDKGVALCLDARTGDEHWMRRIGGNFSASPVYASGRILLLSEEGEATWIAAAKEFEVVAKNQISGKILATPAFDGEAMYLRTDDRLLKIAEPSR